MSKTVAAEFVKWRGGNHYFHYHSATITVKVPTTFTINTTTMTLTTTIAYHLLKDKNHLL